MQPASYTRYHSPLARFILLFVFLYAAFGVFPERPRAGAEKHGGERNGGFVRSADARLWIAVRPIWISRILGDGRALRSGDAARAHPQEHIDARPKLIPMAFRLWAVGQFDWG